MCVLGTLNAIPFDKQIYLFKSAKLQWGLLKFGSGFCHRLTAYKIVGHFFGLPYLNISGTKQVENIFFRSSNISVPCRHSQLRRRTALKDHGHFSDLGVEIALSHRMLNFSGKANTAIHGLGEDDTAKLLAG